MSFTVSKKFKASIKLADIPAYRIARQSNVNPDVLSKLMTGALYVKKGDERVIRVAKVLGLDPSKCFVEVGSREQVSPDQ